MNEKSIHIINITSTYNKITFEKKTHIKNQCNRRYIPGNNLFHSQEDTRAKCTKSIARIIVE